MKWILFVLAVALSFTASSQTTEALQQHRLKYKTDLANDIHADTAKVDFYPFAGKFIINASVEMLKDQPVFNMITSSGTAKEAQKYVKLSFSYNKKHYVLYGYQLTKLKESKEYADHFFVPFKDATTGNTTYAAGRYIDLTKTDIKNGRVVLDFNKAYNPYCAFTDGYNCPIPPKENTLKLAVTAGEKKYLGTHITAD